MDVWGPNDTATFRRPADHPMCFGVVFQDNPAYREKLRKRLRNRDRCVLDRERALKKMDKNVLLADVKVAERPRRSMLCRSFRARTCVCVFAAGDYDLFGNWKS